MHPLVSVGPASTFRMRLEGWRGICGFSSLASTLHAHEYLHYLLRGFLLLVHISHRLVRQIIHLEVIFYIAEQSIDQIQYQNDCRHHLCKFYITTSCTSSPCTTCSDESSALFRAHVRRLSLFILCSCTASSSPYLHCSFSEISLHIKRPGLIPYGTLLAFFWTCLLA